MKIKELISEAAPINFVQWSPSNPSLRGPSSQIRVAQKSAVAKGVQSGRILLKRVDRFLAKGRYAPIIKSKSAFWRNSGRLMRLWTLIGFAGLIESYYDKKSALAIMRGLPPDDEDYMSEDDYNIASRLALESLAVEILVSQGFVRLLQMMKIGKWVVTLAGAFGSAASLGTSFALFLASEYAMIKFQDWLKTDSGQKIVSFAVAWCVDPILGDQFKFMEPFTAKLGEFVGLAKSKPNVVDQPNKDKPTPDDKKPNSGQAGQAERPDTTIPTPNVAPSYKGDPNELTKRAPMPFT
jgi:hypothetical protein